MLKKSLSYSTLYYSCHQSAYFTWGTHIVPLQAHVILKSHLSWRLDHNLTYYKPQDNLDQIKGRVFLFIIPRCTSSTRDRSCCLTALFSKVTFLCKCQRQRCVSKRQAHVGKDKDIDLWLLRPSFKLMSTRLGRIPNNYCVRFYNCFPKNNKLIHYSFISYIDQYGCVFNILHNCFS